MKEQVFSKDWLGRQLTIKTGKLAKQAQAAVTVQYGDTVVLATVVEAKEEREGIDFFPLSVEFEERLYAAGIIKGSRWVKREGRPTDEAVLTGRMIDRSIRPLFSEDSRKEVQIIITVLSVDKENDHDIVSLIAASSVLAISGLNWAGPIGGIRVGKIEDKFVFNPTYEEQAKSCLDLIVAGSRDRVLMIEAGAEELPDDKMAEAILAGHKALQPAIDLIEEMKKAVPAKKTNIEKPLKNEDELKSEEEKEKIFSQAQTWLEENTKKFLFDKTYYTKGERKAAVSAIKKELDKHLFEMNIGKDRRAQAINHLVETQVEKEVSQAILNEEKRVDGRQLTEIRSLTAEVGILPRNHGAGLFSRGETQVMSIVTLGAPGLEQTLEGLEGEKTKRYMHHYNFPPYCVGETKPIRTAGRREIGHGALAEKALFPVIPSKEKFPYTIRVVSETLGSNGSSSMGSTCASTLALMDAGVPIKAPVVGIAMGLASTSDMKQWKVLTDIQDLEDGKGGMDFKITGTKSGITAIQLDTKTIGLDKAIIEKTLSQGRQALNQILELVANTITLPKETLSPYAPRIYTLRVKPERIGEIIGPGGKTINKITEAHGVTIDIDDDGLVMVCGDKEDECKKAVDWIEGIVHEFQVGEIFTGKVVRILDFGIFVELTPGHDGMAHVSELAPYRVGRPENFVDVGQEVTVKIKEIDEQGRINLTLKNLDKNQPLWKDKKGEETGNNNFRNNSFGNGPRRRFNNSGPRSSRPNNKF